MGDESSRHQSIQINSHRFTIEHHILAENNLCTPFKRARKCTRTMYMDFALLALRGANVFALIQLDSLTWYSVVSGVK